MPAAYLKAIVIRRFDPCRKVAFESREHAKLALKLSKNHFVKVDRSMVAAGEGKLNIYRCTICRKWHMGHR